MLWNEIIFVKPNSQNLYKLRWAFQVQTIQVQFRSRKPFKNVTKSTVHFYLIMCSNAATLAACFLTHAKHLIDWRSDRRQIETDGNGERGNGQLEDPWEYGKEHSRINWAHNSEKNQQ